MRWETLFQDLQSQFDAAERAEQDEITAELAEAEIGTVHLADRIRARAGQELRVRLRSGDGLHGRLLDVAPQWFLIGEGERRTLVPLGAVAMAWPLGGAAPEAGPAESRLRITHVLRALARAGPRLKVTCDAGSYSGWLVRIGADHADLRTDPVGAPGREDAVVSFALASLLTVSHP